MFLCLEEISKTEPGSLRYKTHVSAMPSFDVSFPLQPYFPEGLNVPCAHGMGVVNYVSFEGGVLKNNIFAPFSIYPKKMPWSNLLGRGIADDIQIFVARELLRRFGSEYAAVHASDKANRVKQLLRLGIKVNRKYHLDEYVDTMQMNKKPLCDPILL